MLLCNARHYAMPGTGIDMVLSVCDFASRCPVLRAHGVCAAVGVVKSKRATLLPRYATSKAYGATCELHDVRYQNRVRFYAMRSTELAYGAGQCTVLRMEGSGGRAVLS
eukprot:425721-Rhodomonas_salina.2